MVPSIRLLPVVLACLVLVSACGHSRVVRREFAAEPDRATRGLTAPMAIPRNGFYVVKRGETLYSIASRHGLKFQEVATWNGIAEPYTIQSGQRLRLRPPQQQAASATSRQASKAPATSGAGAVASRPNATPRPATAAASVAAKPPPASSGLSWRWPAKGQIVGSFIAGEQTQQGIDIAGKSGQTIAAAADGVVVYSGAGLVGYGELIIIKHNEQWLSAYAHNRRRLVAEGTAVKAGEAVAEMGSTGAVRDMLHFEIRYNGKPVDPLIYLPRP